MFGQYNVSAPPLRSACDINMIMRSREFGETRSHVRRENDSARALTALGLAPRVSIRSACDSNLDCDEKPTNLLLLAGWADRCGRLVTPHLGLSRREERQAAHGPFSLFFSFFGSFAGNSWRAGTAFTPCALRAGSSTRHAHNTVDWILFCAALPPPSFACLACWFHHRRAAVALALFFPFPRSPRQPETQRASDREREKGLTAAPPMLHACLDPNPACALQAEMREKKRRARSTPRLATHQGRNSARKPKATPTVGKCRSGETASPAHLSAVSPGGAARQ